MDATLKRSPNWEEQGCKNKQIDDGFMEAYQAGSPPGGLSKLLLVPYAQSQSAPAGARGH